MPLSYFDAILILSGAMYNIVLNTELGNWQDAYFQFDKIIMTVLQTSCQASWVIQFCGEHISLLNSIFNIYDIENRLTFA